VKDSERPVAVCKCRACSCVVQCAEGMQAGVQRAICLSNDGAQRSGRRYAFGVPSCWRRHVRWDLSNRCLSCRSPSKRAIMVAQLMRTAELQDRREKNLPDLCVTKSNSAQCTGVAFPQIWAFRHGIESLKAPQRPK
jgi:hypothetical protein